MLKPFPVAHRCQAVYEWIAANVAGDCSVLVESPRLGTMVYICLPPTLSLFRRLYGPVADASGLTDKAVMVETSRGYGVSRGPT